MQSRARQLAYKRLLELNEEGAKVDIVDDPHAFRCFIEAATEEDVLVGSFRTFEAQTAFKNLPEPARAAFKVAVDARLALLRGAAGSEEFA